MLEGEEYSRRAASSAASSGASSEMSSLEGAAVESRPLEAAHAGTATAPMLKPRRRSRSARPAKAVPRPATDYRRTAAIIGIAIALVALLGSLFYGIDRMNATRAISGATFFQPETLLDTWIPFSPAWIWIYLSYFPLCFTTIILITNRRRIVVFAQAFIMQYLVGALFFLLLPSRMDLPAVGGETLSERAFQAFRHLDPGFNIFPSMHVANIICIALCFSFMKPRWAWVIWVWTLLITVSTVLVKQHFLLDVPAGALLGVAAALWIRRVSVKA